MLTFIQQLEQALARPLPGPEAQYKMAHVARKGVGRPPENAKEAGVLALLFPKNKEWQLTLIQRNSDNPNDRHSGQISFPGGKREAEDTDLAATALRETEEEVGVPRNEIKLLGALSELYIPVSNFRVAPFVGYLESEPDFRPQPSEVQSVLRIPFSHFLQQENRRLKNMTITSQIKLKDVPYYDVDQQVVWGATAMMISELVEVLA